MRGRQALLSPVDTVSKKHGSKLYKINAELQYIVVMLVLTDLC